MCLAVCVCVSRCVCLCVCVCERVRKRDRQIDRYTEVYCWAPVPPCWSCLVPQKRKENARRNNHTIPMENENSSKNKGANGAVAVTEPSLSFSNRMLASGAYFKHSSVKIMLEGKQA